MANEKLIMGTRGSALALWQTNWVADALRRAHPGLEPAIQTITTRGDSTQATNVPLSSFGEKGIFAKELEESLLAHEIHMAVHSMKDLAHTLPNGLCIAAVPARESAADAIIGGTLETLPKGARIGTGSVRRRALLRERRPDLEMLEIRGNIDTRLRKLDEGQYDAIVLAVAGLRRLEMEHRISEELDTAWFVPDPGQGALAIQTRTDDEHTRHCVSGVNDPMAFAATSAERAFLAAVGGSCQTPIGAHAAIDGNSLRMRAMVADKHGIRRVELIGPRDDASALGKRAAEALR